MLEYRFMTENDLEETTKLYKECFPEMVKYINTINYRDNILLAIIDNKIVGMVTIDYLYDNFLNEKYAYINNVCVSTNYRGKKIGYNLMLRCEEIAKKENCKYIKLTSNKNRIAAHKLYNNLNYKIYDTTVFKKNI